MDFDRWRAEYDDTPFEAQVAFYEEVAARFPDQRQFGQLVAGWALKDATTVTEVGGWRGELAAAVLPESRIGRWTNYDICRWAVENPACTEPAYEAVALGDWPWETDLLPADAFVASHVLEHIRFRELEQLAEQFHKFKLLHLDIPVGEDPTDWTGYFGTHILEVGWREIDGLLQGHGFASLDTGRTRTYRGVK